MTLSLYSTYRCPLLYVGLVLVVLLALLAVHDKDPEDQLLSVVVVEDAVQIGRILVRRKGQPKIDKHTIFYYIFCSLVI
jgi:hypothetical protein